MVFKNSAKFLTIMSLSIFTSIVSAQDKPIDDPQKVTKPTTPDELKLLQLIREELASNELLLNDLALATTAYRLTSQSGKITQALCSSVREKNPVNVSKGLIRSIKDSSALLVEFRQVTPQYASEVEQRIDLKATDISRNMVIIGDDCNKKFSI